MDSSEIYDQVREHYSSASRSTSVKYGEAVAKSFGYSADELSNIPEDANLGLSCGNPLAIASLKEASQPFFLHANITSVPLPAATADCIISNCVINLVPPADKPAVFREMHRLLKPGGRVAVSDILAKRPLPERLVKDVAMYVGCVAGASEVREYVVWLEGVGFGGTGTGCDSAGTVPAATTGSGGAVPAGVVPEKTDLNEYVGSYKIFAVKN
ncbi:hypothetical protein CHGG_06091 [Chaetomium globosum CBS 148.51]|uniref:Arsenite methyltransferase n=1 Tax=Chaetomium globosum (strain ATCC 6205 / CBS 148.51 / DSM 1962 / NBRC 6347 / NRRL 1970) TaxID=306901 RepID=Q2H5H4_CHAGB|nr:uncharacterized protein CHGG_06091 [Chaetomium globosum CBS 148.51]EAQ89472.1 hypothetical protein CHGG_06091 [Chaetomium globosum CBS 148.51]